MDPIAIAMAVGIALLGEWVVGHFMLFPALCFGARLHPRNAIRIAHCGGLALGWGVAAGCVPQSSSVLVFWGGNPPLPGLAISVCLLLWLLFVVFSRPGPKWAVS